ncbi:glutaredoxin domain-containing protein [Decorospora gaudefroyi]|uniref:Glutaredoxin domain-containing protein n=1 Tax=Decorospora gaudefroyi TaxID=184978 RepID=A0A6A5KPR6_9PLEO|nr:glutaredoxin domain-containing protein [Decorospora gaudefroyi]
MPSQRRMRFYGTLIVLTIVVLYYMSRGEHQTTSSDFYTKTQQALQEREYAEAAKQRDADGVGSRLKAAEEQAKKNAGDKYIEVKGSVEGPDHRSVAGRVKMDGDKVPGVAQQGGRPHDQAAMKENETPEDHEVEIEMNAILKKSPMIIFSKSYCPFSMKAKRILLETYRIVPEPYVVELDQNPMGEKLQDFLHKSTGRRTVPNILLMGKSLGGGDDMAELDQTDQLVAKIKEIGGSRITEVEHRGARPEMQRRAKA